MASLPTNDGDVIHHAAPKQPIAFDYGVVLSDEMKRTTKKLSNALAIVHA